MHQIPFLIFARFNFIMHAMTPKIGLLNNIVLLPNYKDVGSINFHKRLLIVIILHQMFDNKAVSKLERNFIVFFKFLYFFLRHEFIILVYINYRINNFMYKFQISIYIVKKK